MSDAALVVKVRCVAPIEQELHVAVDDSWTVGDLKRHVSGNFPGRPEVASQHLVCAGYLLEDDSRPLKECLKVDLGCQQVIHLICRHDLDSAKLLAGFPSSNIPTDKAEQQATNDSGNAGTSSSAGVNAAVYEFVNYSMACQQQFLYYYYCYMAHYHGILWQSMQTGAHAQRTAESAPARTLDDGAGPADQENNAAPAAAAAEGGGQPQVQPVLNAQGLGEEEEQPRDWLDFMYMISRALLLMAVIYMYSSLGRFALVICFALFFYALEAGWFGRWEHRGQDDQQQQQQQQQQQVVGAEPAGAAAETTGEQGPVVDHAEDGSEPEAPQPSPPPPSQQGHHQSAWNVFWSTCWIFVSSFFASLLPQRPVARQRLG